MPLEFLFAKNTQCAAHGASYAAEALGWCYILFRLFIRKCQLQRGGDMGG